MRIVQINTVPNLSTGTVMLENHKRYVAEGHESWRMWGRGREPENEYEFKFGSTLSVAVDGLETRAFGKPGFHSKKATKQLLTKLDEINPDIVHLHNIHGYYVNVEMLFKWLAKHDCQVIWTLHDCWAFTGQCPHFVYVQCDQWKTGCAAKSPCPQLDVYPKTHSKSSCKRSYKAKKRLFTLLPEDRMRLIVPSKWLADLTRESFLGKYSVEVHYNTIDTEAFKPMASTFRTDHNIDNKFVILGVASSWTERKGLDDFVRLSQELNDSFAIVLVGLTREQKKSLPDSIIGLEKTSSREELVKIYSAADVFYNPTKEDNYPTVNLEAESVGLPVVTHDVGGCRETILGEYSVAVKGYEEAIVAIRALANSADDSEAR